VRSDSRARSRAGRDGLRGTRRAHRHTSSDPTTRSKPPAEQSPSPLGRVRHPAPPTWLAGHGSAEHGLSTLVRAAARHAARPSAVTADGHRPVPPARKARPAGAPAVVTSRSAQSAERTLTRIPGATGQAVDATCCRRRSSVPAVRTTRSYRAGWAVMLACALGLLMGAGSAGATTGTYRRAAVVPSPVRLPVAVAVPACPAARLRLSEPLPSRRVATGYRREYVLTNVGRSRCALSGYPRVRLFDVRGRVLDSASPGAGPLTDDRGVRPVVLQRGGSAFFALSYFGWEPPLSACPLSRVTRVALPGQRASFRLLERFAPCRGQLYVTALTANEKALHPGWRDVEGGRPGRRPPSRHGSPLTFFCPEPLRERPAHVDEVVVRVARELERPRWPEGVRVTARPDANRSGRRPGVEAGACVVLAGGAVGPECAAPAVTAKRWLSSRWLPASTASTSRT